MSWRGSDNNRSPNPKNHPVPDAAGMNRDELRSHNMRRDNDKDSIFSISVMDVDTVILNYLNSINLQVLDNNVSVKVPIILESPEKWHSIKKEGVIRDFNGKVQYPILAFRRTNIRKNKEMGTFNRHSEYPVLTKFDAKNRYDRFSILNGNYAPAYKVTSVTIPDYVVFTYEFIIWTEKVEQMNAIIEKINFAEGEYWGDKKRLKFKVTIDDYSLNVETPTDNDRIVKTEFQAVVNAYLIPDSFEDKSSTNKKSLTNRAISLSCKISTGEQIDKMKKDELKEKARYVWKDGVVLDSTAEFKQPKPNLNPTVTDESFVIKSVRQCYEKLISSSVITQTSGSSSGGIVWHTAPSSPDSYGEEGWMAYDGDYHYIYASGKWRKIPLMLFQ